MALTRQSLRAAFAGLVALVTLGILPAAASGDMTVGQASGDMTVGQVSGDMTVGQVSGLPIPRFVSLKSDRVNVRAGPNKDQDVRWVYTRAGMPVEITAEFENWRRIRDWEGAEGWVYHSLLSGKRTAIVVPKLHAELVPLYDEPDVHATVLARLQAGVLGSLKSCDGTWCRFSGKNFSGYIRQDRLWGAYPNEKVE